MRHPILGFMVVLVLGWGFRSQCSAQESSGATTATVDMTEVPPGSQRQPQSTDERAEPAEIAMVQLDNRPTRAYGRSDGGLLVREIFRQALLIAGREQLGLVTRDATLGDLIADASRVHLVVKLIPSKSIDLKVIRHRQDQDELLWEKTIQGDFAAGKRADYMKLVELAEGYSRDEFVLVLKQFGWTKAPEQPTSARNEEKIDGEMNPHALSFIDEFAAVRRLHARSRSQLQAPARLAQLVLGYANLGQLTLYHWSAAHKAFEARALLYAQRLHVQDKQSPFGYWIRAYAEAMAGLDALALRDLEMAEKLYHAMKPDDRPERPAWVDLLNSYCHYRTSELLDAAGTSGAYQSLALLLALRTLEGTSARSAILNTVKQALKVNPECYRMIDALCRVGGVGNLRRATLLGPQTLATGLPERLRAIADLPPAVAKMLAPGDADHALVRRARELFELPDVETSPAVWKLAQALVDASAADRGELSWGVLGRLIQATIFMQAQRRAHFMRYTWSVSTEDFIAEVLPTLSDHPYRGFLESYRFNSQRERDKFHAVLKDLDMTDPQVKMVPMITATWKLNAPGKMQGIEAWRSAFLHADATATDQAEIIASTRKKQKAPYARTLFEISPHSALAMATLIYQDWSFASDYAARWETEHGDHPAVLAALAWRYHSLKRYADAEPLLRRCIDSSPDKWAYETLVEGYLKRNDEAQWLETLQEFLTQPDHRLGHAKVRVRIARHYMAKDRWEDARPYALAVAATWANWAMKCAVKCEEGLGNWEEAELWVRRISQRYANSQTNWYLWCKRTGRGDVQQAKQLTEAWMQSVRHSSKLDDIRVMGIVHILDGRQREALDAFQRSYTTQKSPYDGLHVALLATELKDEETRSKVLQTIVQTPPGGGGQTEHRFARLLHDHFNDEAELSLQIVDGMISASNKAERANIQYFAGRFLELAGRKDEGLKYLKQCALHGDKTRWSIVLVSDLLRSRGIDWHEND